MEKIIEKISNYHIFNHLVPGILFIIISDYTLGTNIYSDDIIYLFFISYFIGIAISRIGSLIVANVLYLFTKENGEDYKKYINACEKDSKIDILIQDKNMYRNICTMLILILLIKVISIINFNINISRDLKIIIVLCLMIILFAISFLKQNKYISSRIRAKKNNK